MRFLTRFCVIFLNLSANHLFLSSNAINGTNVFIIYAQTPKFSIKGDSCEDPVSTSTCPSAATVTVRPQSVVTKTQTITYAICPNTVGWGPSGYGSPG